MVELALAVGDTLAYGGSDVKLANLGSKTPLKHTSGGLPLFSYSTSAAMKPRLAIISVRSRLLSAPKGVDKPAIQMYTGKPPVFLKGRKPVMRYVTVLFSVLPTPEYSASKRTSPADMLTCVMLTVEAAIMS